MSAFSPASAATLADEQRDVARARIVRAARRALAERGLATTVDDVAAAAGVSRRTVFRHFTTRENLFAVAIREGLQAYADQLTPAPADGQGGVGQWLEDTLRTAHRINARNGRIYWELSALETELPGELAAVALERRQRRKAFAASVSRTLWKGRGGTGRPPTWLIDAVAVHLSGFTTQSLAGDFGRTPDQVAEVSAKVLEASVAVAIAERSS